MPTVELIPDPSPLPVLITRVWETSASHRAWGRRKLRLFACACCRRIWHLMEDDVSRRAVDVAERYADGVARAAELTSVRRAFGPRSSPSTPATEAAEAAKAVVHRQAWEAAQHAALYACSAAGMVRGVREEYSAGFGAERDEQTALFRDIVGPLGEPAPLGRPLMTADVVGLARGIDADLAFDRLPILADALMDAGCEDEHILAHCRSEGPHVRGCWVVDSIIGEE